MHEHTFSFSPECTTINTLVHILKYVYVHHTNMYLNTYHYFTKAGSYILFTLFCNLLLIHNRNLLFIHNNISFVLFHLSKK